MIINSLKLRAERDRHDIGRFRLEEALRAASQPAEKLIIVRKVSLGKLDFSDKSRQLSNHVQQSLTEKYSNAVHASGALNGSADVVWFRSINEARRLFLDLIINGHKPNAWFWRLAVEDWNGGAAIDWLDQQVSAAATGTPQAVALGRELLAIARKGGGKSIVEIFAKLSEHTRQKFHAPSHNAGDRQTETGSQYLAGKGPPPNSVALSQLESLANQLRRQRALRDILEAGMARNDRSVAVMLTRLLVSAVRPDLASRVIEFPKLADDIATLVVIDEPQQRTSGKTFSAEQLSSDGPVERCISKAQNNEPTASDLEKSSKPSVDEIDTGGIADSDNESEASDQETPPANEEQYFSNAGLFLIVPTLNRLGLELWLEKKQSAFDFNFSANLIIYIASQYGDKNSRSLIPLLGLDADETPNILMSYQEEFRSWSKLADKWLRRKARRRLHDLALRGGWIAYDSETLNIRYREAAADIRLRRLALDINPGWVPWLGRSVNYHFSDDPIDSELSTNASMQS